MLVYQRVMGKIIGTNMGNPWFPWRFLAGMTLERRDKLKGHVRAIFDYWRWINSTYHNISRFFPGFKGIQHFDTLLVYFWAGRRKPVLDQITGVSRQILMRQWRLLICKFWRLASQRTFDMPRYLPPTVSVGACCVFCEGEVGQISHRLYDLMLVCLRFPSWLIKTYPLVWGDPTNPEPACIHIYIYTYIYIYIVYIYIHIYMWSHSIYTI